MAGAGLDDRAIVQAGAAANYNLDCVVRPILKWVGGKTQIMDKVMECFPKKMNNYIEPFLGGGSVMLAALSLAEKNQIKIDGAVFACDANLKLINMYVHVQKNKERLFERMMHYARAYDSIAVLKGEKHADTEEQARASKESYYYWLRGLFNRAEEGSVDEAALFIVVNKTCFRGMYREGPNGFNVPFGSYKACSVPTESELSAVSELIKDVEFTHCDFVDAVEMAEAGDFVYMDPPYAPENEASFVGYNADGFDADKHEQLFGCLRELKENGVAFAMSNANVEMVTTKCAGFDISTFDVKRAINAKNPGAKSTEVIVRNMAP